MSKFIEIDGVEYPLNFGMAFLRDIDGTMKVKDDSGVMRKVGFQNAVAGLIDGNPESLVDIIVTASKGQTPRLTRDILEAHIDDENTDIDALYEDVLDFLSKSNACRKKTEQIREMADKLKQANEAKMRKMMED